MIQEYVDDFRPTFKGCHSDYLFPAQDDGPKGHNTLLDNLTAHIRKQTGVTINPHLFRHLIAKLAVERDPGMALAVSRHLGHKRVDTTMQHYLGTEGRTVSRRIDAIINEARQPTVSRNPDRQKKASVIKRQPKRSARG